jgi:O-antigen chain-terminating methyltransferase
MRGQNADFHGALERHAFDIQKRLWADLEKMRTDVERIIHAELRMVRQRAQLAAAAPESGVPPGPRPVPTAGPGVLGPERVQGALREGPPHAASPPLAPLAFDYARFAEKFRGPEEYVKTGQKIYLPYFAGCRNVLDIGCGRGEFLKMMRDAGIPARGIDLSQESVAACRFAGLDAEVADAFRYLEGLPEGSLDGVFCAQVVEHLPPERLPELIRGCASRLAPGGVIAIETPNPECLAIFATHFYLDPTHTRPVPHLLLIFYLEEFGVGNIELRRLSPARESMPAIDSLPEEFREAFFGALDYAVIGRKL